jgi:cbb3-type cytochrome oxidase subunit 3
MMQGMNGSAFAVPGVLLLTLEGVPIFFWIAVLTIVLAVIFFVYAAVKRRKEAREARATASIRQRVT